MQRPEDIPPDKRIKRGKDDDRFYCPYEGCSRSFAELWRLKVHYRAPPDVRGSGKERGHGTELQFCPKCDKELKPGKHHVGCFSGRGGSRQAVKRLRDVEESKEEQADTPTESARQRSRTGALPDIKFEDVLPRARSLNQFSEEAASLTSGWHGEQSAAPLAQDSQDQSQHQSANSDLLDTKPTDQFLKYQQVLPNLRRPSRSHLGLSSNTSPPPSPPWDVAPALVNMRPLFDFSRFDPDRARGRNAVLPVAVTSTLHASSDLPLPPDDLVLQALLGDATSFAASGANQLASAATAERHQLQNALAQQRIEQVAASAQELLRLQGPPLPQSANSAPRHSNIFPSPPQNFANSLADISSRDQTLASLLQQPNQLVQSLEHYESPGSGRPGRMHGQQQSRFQSLSPSWIHKPVASRWPSHELGGAGLSPLPSPLALLNTHQHPHTPGSLQSLLPWDFSTWGGFPTDVEANVAQGFRLREQHQQQQQQQQELKQQQQQQQQQQQRSSSVTQQRNSEYEYRHQGSEQHPQQPNNISFLNPSAQSVMPQGGYLGSQFQYNMPHVTAAMPQADQFGFPEFVSADDAMNEAFLSYSRRLSKQDAPNQDMLQLQNRPSQIPWGAQESGLFDAMGGISPEPSASFSHSAPDLSTSLPMRGRSDTGEQLQSGPPSRLPSPEPQTGSLSGWSHLSGRSLLERMNQLPQPSSEHVQASPHASLLQYDDHSWPLPVANTQQEQQQQQQQQQSARRH